MSTAKIREKLHDYIEKGDERFLKIVYAMAKEYLEGEPEDYELTEDQWNIVNERRAEYMSGKAKTYPLEEALKRVRSRRNKK